MHSLATGMLTAEEVIDGRAHTINIDDLRIARFVANKESVEANIY
jgi:sarcosine oxidase subunit beta